MLDAIGWLGQLVLALALFWGGAIFLFWAVASGYGWIQARSPQLAGLLAVAGAGLLVLIWVFGSLLAPPAAGL